MLSYISKVVLSTNSAKDRGELILLSSARPPFYFLPGDTPANDVLIPGILAACRRQDKSATQALDEFLGHNVASYDTVPLQSEDETELLLGHRKAQQEENSAKPLTEIRGKVCFL